MNFSDRETERRLAELVDRISKIYGDAGADLEKSFLGYIDGYTTKENGKLVYHKGLLDRYEEEYKAYKEGKYTKEQFDAWVMSQIGRGDRIDKLTENCADRLSQANRIASDYINEVTPNIFSLNANYSAYEIEKGTGVAFDLVDEETIKGLMTGRTKILPISRAIVDEKKSKAWDEQKLVNALTSGIIRGLHPTKIAKEFMNVADMEKSVAIRNARTFVTNAQNAGRQASYEKAHENGIDIRKEWIATNDDRTRDSHAELDGVQVEYDELFPNGLMHPGDSNGSPSEVYNCRCTMRAILPKYNGEQRESNVPDHEGSHTKETYKEWYDRKIESMPPTTHADATHRAMRD